MIIIIYFSVVVILCTFMYTVNFELDAQVPAQDSHREARKVQRWQNEHFFGPENQWSI